MSFLAHALARALHLCLLALAPWALSPDPAPVIKAALATRAGLAAVVLAGAAVLALRLARSGPTTPLRRAGRLGVATLGASVIVAAALPPGRVPLACGLLVVAPLLWAGLAVGVSGWLARSESKAAWSRGVGAVLAVAVASYGLAARSLVSIPAMRASALARDPANPAAVRAAVAELLAAHKLAEARAVADACAAADPDGCGCRDVRSEIALAQKDGATALADVQLALSRCDADARVHARSIEVEAGWGDAARAEREATQALATNPPDAARIRYARSLALQRLERLPEAREEAARAAAAGAGRDARLVVAVLDLLQNRLDQAKAELSALAAENPADVDVAYDLALVADRRGDYNGAREGYLRCLRLDPGRFEARYNLALLTWRAGAKDEARHHLQKLREVAPNDPRLAHLVATFGE